MAGIEQFRDTPSYLAIVLIDGNLDLCINIHCLNFLNPLIVLTMY
jgi:hypothetical protein